MTKIIDILLNKSFNILFPIALGTFRILAYLLLRLIPSFFYKPYKQKHINKDDNNNYTKEDVTYIIPIYMPEEDLKMCLVSWIKNQPKEIILVPDISCEKEVTEIKNTVLEEISENNIPNIRIISEKRPGKRRALATGYENTNTEIIIFVDDDVWHCDTMLENLIIPFNDKKRNTGGVGPGQICRSKREKYNIWEIIMDMRLFQRYLEIKATTLFGGGSPCIAGRTMAWRKSMLDETNFVEDFLNETFMGKKQLSGDDKYLTRLCINSDYGMYHQMSKDCYVSTRFEDPPVLFYQLLRWGRNTIRSDIKLICLERKVWCKYPFLAVVMVDRFLTPFTMFIGLILALIYGNMELFYLILLYIFVIRTFKLIPYFTYFKPKLKYNYRFIPYVPIFILATYIGALLKLWALFSLNNRKWGNREVKVNDNDEIVRTGIMENFNQEYKEKNEILDEINMEEIDIVEICIIDD